MKRKVLLLLLCGLLVVTTACIGVMTANSMGIRVGRCLKADNGNCLLLMEHSPVVLSNHTLADNIFNRYQTGDLLLVLHDGIQETYPGRTAAYLTLRLSRGTAAEIPRAIIDALAELGWHIQTN
ncbi:MAG: hypothetical protein IJA56_03885 [Clostridia bacterium]|nr:hypothetical protein [Clostridia bacterium]